MTSMIEDRVMALVAALQNDEHPAREGNDEGAPEFDAYALGEHIYGVRVDNRLGREPQVDIHVQWPRLHCWIVHNKQEGRQLTFSHSVLGPDDIHVHVGIAGSIISYTAILERPVLVEMLKERGHNTPMPAGTPAETLWKMVLEYECL